MKSPIGIVLGVALLALAAGPVEAAALKAQALVNGAEIALGDVIAEAGGAASAIVAASPEPGQRKVLSAAEIARVALAHGVETLDMGGLSRVAVTRAGKPTPLPLIEEEIAAALRAQGVAGDRRIRLTGAQDSLMIPVDAKPTVGVEALTYDALAERFTATLSLPLDGGVRLVTLSGRVVEVVSLPVLNRAVAKGDRIVAADIDWIDAPPSRAQYGVIADEAALIGMSAARPLRPGQPVRANDVTPPVMVAKGGLVTLVVESRFMQLSSLGRALDAGGMGEAVRVTNIDSRRTVEGVVTGPGEVRVGSSVRRTAAR